MSLNGKELISLADESCLQEIVQELLRTCAQTPEEEKPTDWWVHKQEAEEGEKVMDPPREGETACWVEFDPTLHEVGQRHLVTSGPIWDACVQMFTELTKALWNILCTHFNKEDFVDQHELLNYNWSDLIDLWVGEYLYSAIGKIMEDAHQDLDPRDSWGYYKEFLAGVADHVEANFHVAIDR